MKVLLATSKPFAKIAVDGIRKITEDAGFELVLLEKYSIAEAFETAYADSSEKLSMMLDIKSDEFTDYIFDKALEKKSDITINSTAVDSIKLSTLVTDSTKMGTLSEESDESSDESSAEGSDAE